MAAQAGGGYNRNLNTEVRNFMRELEALGSGADAYAGIVDDTMHRVLEVVRDEVLEFAPVAGGELSKGFRTQIHGQPLRRGYYGEVLNITDYAAAVENGTEPHMPPVQSIAWWVRKKGLAVNVTRKQRSEGVQIRFRRAGSTGRYPAGVSKDEWAIAWAIAMKIKRDGTKGQRFFRKGFAAARPQVYELWRECVDRIVRELAVRTEGAGL